MSDANDDAGETGAPLLATTAAVTTWNGIGMTLAVDAGAKMPQTPNGTLVFGYFNLSPTNSEGELQLTSGGSYSRELPVPPQQSAPAIVVYNWRANNLAVTNTSRKADTSIYISAYGPGVPGQAPRSLPLGKSIDLGTTASAQGGTNPQNMRLKLTVGGSVTGVFAVVGGPLDASGNNAKVIAVNYPAGTAPPDGYYATTPENTYVLSFNWNGASVYVVNMSASGAPVGQVLLQAV